MRSNSKRKSLPVYLLCCVMLAGLLLGISVMVVNAEPLYYAENVGGMKRGTEVCYYTKTPDGELQRNFETSSNFGGKTLDAKWDAMKQTFSQKDHRGGHVLHPEHNLPAPHRQVRQRGHEFQRGLTACLI